MYAGKIIEQANVMSLFKNPKHHYTKGLLSSIPKIGTKTKYLPTIRGMVPAADNRPNGCYFVERCEHKIDICSTKSPDPKIADKLTNHTVSCWNPYER